MPDPSTFSVAPKVITIDPVTRIEGHLRINVTVDQVGGVAHVVDAWSSGTLFRGFESILAGRDPWDAVPITQRVCGVCPVSHGMAATLMLEAASRVSPPANGRILRNLVLASNYLQSHILHFYHLALLDFVDGPPLAPWTPHWNTDRRADPATAKVLVDHYLGALEMRRKAHEMAAIFGGRMPHPPTFVPGGITNAPTRTQVSQFLAYLNQLEPFIKNVWRPDILTIGRLYPEYLRLGSGPGNLLAFGVFDLDTSGRSKFLPAGRVVKGSATVQPVDLKAITESVGFSWYDAATDNRHPSNSSTKPAYPKADAYSWLKAPRYQGLPYEAGPLARMWISGAYRESISVLGRHMARAIEAEVLCAAMRTWLGQIVVGKPVFAPSGPITSAEVTGLTEAPRGALGHWCRISNGKIASYQIITPTCWNASPRDTAGQRGPLELSLIGTPVQNLQEPIEVMRVVHSFDPCLACAVHVMRPGAATQATVSRAV
jgi:hydrogenase large subunit